MKTSPAADGDEDDLDGDAARRGGWGGGALGSSGGGRTPLRGGSGRSRPHTSAFETPPSRTPRRRSVAEAVERASRLLGGPGFWLLTRWYVTRRSRRWLANYILN